MSERFLLKDLLSLLPIVGIFLIFWLFVIRPASRRQKELREVQQALVVGDEVITNSGFFGVIDSFDGDRIGLRIAPEVVVTIARQAIVGKPREEGEPGSDSRSEEHTSELQSLMSISYAVFCLKK